MKRGFRYTDASGRPLKKTDVERIAELVIPPAWQFVRIAPTRGSRIQAVGMDTTGRVQYIYNTRFAERRQKKKFEKIERFGRELSKLREAVDRDILLSGLSKQKVLAVILKLINSLYFRVGTDESAEKYKTFGVTTLQNRHLEIGHKGELIFKFVGKSRVQHKKMLVDKKLARIMAELKNIGPKKKLFNYIDDEGTVRTVRATDVNRYIKDATSEEFSSKDLRTWGASVMAAAELARLGTTDDPKQINANIIETVKKVAETIGNTPTVCRSSYIHPHIIESYKKGKACRRVRRSSGRISITPGSTDAEERALLAFFKK